MLLTKDRLVVGAGWIARKTGGAVYTLGEFSYTLGGVMGRAGAGGMRRRGTKVFSVVTARGGVKNPARFWR